MSLSGTVAANKDSAPLGYRPLLLAVFQFTDGTYLRLSTNPLNVAEGGYQYGGNDYLARLASQDITAVQARSESGIDRIPAATLHLVDPDRYLWTNYEQAKGFKGATVTLSLILVDIDDSTGAFVYSSDAPTKFVGVCDAPTLDASGALMAVAATSSRNMAKVYLPPVQIQQRCPWVFPSTAAQRLDGATNPASQHWECGYNPDQAGTDPELGTSCLRGNLNGASPYTTCGYTKADCQARGMFDLDSSSRATGRFGGEQWAPRDRSSRTKSYVEGKTVTAFNARNDAIYTDRVPLLYGTQWIEPPVVVNELGDGNSTRMECILCLGDIGTSGVLQVVVNGVIVPQNGAGSDPLFRWNFVGNPLGSHTGSRNGSPTKDAGYNDGSGNPQGEPHGSYATIEIVVYRQLAESNSVPQVRVLARGPSIWQYAKISSVTSGVATLTTANRSCAGNSPFTVQITGNSNGALNGYFGLTSWTYGPPGTVTLSGSSASGTGGYIRWKSSTESNNPAWVLLDVLTWAGWQFSQLDIDTFIAAAEICDASVTYTDLTGNASATHNRFIADLVLHQRRTAAEVIQQLLTSFRAQLVPNSETGLLQLFIRQTLADSQPAAITGSNYNTAVKSITASGSTANGYVAYLIDESTVLRTQQDGAPSIRVYSDTSAATPNRVAFNFQDADNSYAQDSISVVDIDGVLRAGGYQAGQENVEQMPVIGISNFDQATRTSNTYLAERLRGNEAGDTRGTRYFEIPLSPRMEHLRVGHICLLRYAPLALQPATQLQSPSGTPVTGILVRVVAIKPTTDYEGGSLTLAWHEDSWYTDAYGQQGAPAYSAAGKERPARLPYPWRPYGQQPMTGNMLYQSSEWNFSLALSYEAAADGSQIAKLTVGGCAPVTDTSAVPPPLMGPQGTTASTGGHVAGNQTYVMYACGIDSAGKLTVPSKPCVVAVPSGTSTNTITTPTITWPSGTVGYALFAGVDDQHLSYQTGGASSPPSTITVSTLKVAEYGPPDQLFDALRFYAKRVAHGGVWGAACTSVGTNTIQFSGAGFTVNEWAGRYITRVGQSGTGALAIADFQVSSNTSDTLTVTPDPLALGYTTGDVWIMLTAPTAADSTSFTDSKFVNVYATGGLTASAEKGNRARIIAGTGRGQVRTITGNTTTKITISPAWDTTPDSTSIIIIEESSWQDAPDVEHIATSDPSTAQTVAVLNIDNYKGQTVLVQAMTVDADGNECLEAFAPVRMIYVAGSAPAGGTGYHTAAPNVTGATATVLSSSSVGATPTFQVGGTVTVDETAAAFAHLMKIHVKVSYAGVAFEDMQVLVAPFTVSSHTISYRTTALLRQTADTYATLYFYVENEYGEITPSPYSTSVLVTGAAGPAVNSITTVTSVSFVERSSSRYSDSQQLTYLGLDVTLGVSNTLFSPPGAEYVTLWISFDNGTTYRWLNWYLVSGAAPVINIGHQGDTTDPGPLAPLSSQTWKIKAAAGQYGSAAAIPGTAAVSSGVSITALANPASTTVTSASITGPVYTQNEQGIQFWGITAFAYTITGSDPNIWSTQIWVRDVDSAGNAAPGDPGQWHLTGRQFTGLYGSSVAVTQPLGIESGRCLWDIPSSATYNYKQFKITAFNRLNSHIDQASWPASATTYKIGPIVNQGNTVPTTVLDPSTMGTGIARNPSTGYAQAATANLTNLLWDGDFELSTAGTLGSYPSQWTSGGGGGATVEIKSDATALSGTKYARLTGPGAYIQQGFRARAGEAYYLDAYVRSNNVGGTHETFLAFYAYDNSGAQIGSTLSTSKTGYQSAFTKISAIFDAPANTVTILVRIINNGSENASGYWDVDSMIVYQPPVMVSNSQTNHLGQVSSLSSYTLSSATSSTDSRFFRDGLNGIDALDSNGDTLSISGASGRWTIDIDYGGGKQLTMDYNGGNPRFYVSDGTNVTQITGLHLSVNGVNKW